ncbi:UDP-glucose dehydrogenase family protein [Allorhizobium pseudoryzae]|uniref:UDP-glucose dehydrogenase family protein n=1 Tax=Allorhizobium pseudoryzae TaxID=379684 RepID=UPI003D078A24
MRITIFGIGYVGLVQAAVLAETGHDVLCVDIDPDKIENLKKGIIPIYEPGLEPMVKANFNEGRLLFTTDIAAGVDFGAIQMIAVGTPPGEDGSADLRHVLKVAASIGQAMNEDKIVVTKSTVPVGTGQKVGEAIAAELAKRSLADSLSVSIVSNPEFLKEGSAVADCSKPDRIIVGCDDTETIEVMRELYAPFNRNRDRMIVMDLRSAEFTKYAANCMLASRISFMNEMANLAELVGADIERVRVGIGSDPRIGYDFIYAGIGYGGSCFPKDVSALIRTAESVSYEPTILKAVEERNRAQKGVLFDKITDYFEGDLKGRRLALWGLAFKANTDDMRESPARVLLEQLWAAGATVQAFDPEAMVQCQEIYGQRDDLVLCGTKEAALRHADGLIVATEWKNFRSPSFDLIRQALNHPVIFDGRNMYAPATVAQHGLDYFSIGRAPVRVSGETLQTARSVSAAEAVLHRL